MHAHDEGLFVVATIEDADATALGQANDATPHEIVVELFVRRRFEGIDLAALRGDAGHEVVDPAVLAGGGHPLEDQQNRPAVLRVEHVLKLPEQRDTHGERFLGTRLILRREIERVAGIDVLKTEPVIYHPKGLGQFAGLFDKSFHLFFVHWLIPSLIGTHYSIGTIHSARSSGLAPFRRTAPPLSRSRQRSRPWTPCSINRAPVAQSPPRELL